MSECQAAGANHRAQHASARRVLPELTAAVGIEGVHTRFRSGLRVDIRTGNNPIRCDEDVAVEEVLLCGAVAYVRLPLDLTAGSVEAPEDAIAGSEVHLIARAESPRLSK